MFHLITGGSGSGKSSFAETVICRQYEESAQNNANAELYYIATMIPYGKETEKKIQRHREMRKDKGFSTIECYTDLVSTVQKKMSVNGQCCVLLECMSNLVANELYEPTGAGKDTVFQIMEGIRELQKCGCHLVVVTNEVCSDSSADSPEMQEYKKMLGEINCQIAVAADEVTEVVYGIPVSIKGETSMCKEDKGLVNTALKLVIGGACQGKRKFAETQYGNIQWVDGKHCSTEELYTCQGILHFETYIRRLLKEGQDIRQLAAAVVRENPEVIIVSQEIGYGLVPVDAFEREYREQTGRVCTELASYAAEVNRVVCGIGFSLKGE